jgi:hypothetical protein
MRDPITKRIYPERFRFEETGSSSSYLSPTGEQKTTTETSRKVSIDPEDVIAVFAGVVALVTVGAMIFHALPLNALTVGLAGFSGAGAAIAAILGARTRKKRHAQG